jgi:hypothetical protein
MSRVTLYGKGTAMLERLKTILKDLGPGWNVEVLHQTEFHLRTVNDCSVPR